MADEKTPIKLCVRWNAEKGHYEVFERGTDRRLQKILIDGITVTPPGGSADPADFMDCEVEVFGVIGAEAPENEIYAGLKVLREEGKAQPVRGQDALRVVDAATGRSFARLTYIEARAGLNEVFQVNFGFLAMGNEPSPEHRADYTASKEE